MCVKKCIKALEKRIKKILESTKKTSTEERKKRKKEREKTKVKQRRIEKMIGRQETEKRRKNIIIRGLEIKSGKSNKAMKEVMNRIEVKVNIREINRIGGRREEGKKMVVVKVGGEEQKKEIVKKKASLKGKRERILKDCEVETRGNFKKGREERK